jgi:hypothetical protein
MSTSSTLKALTTVAFGVVLFATAPQIARAQICAGSYLNYIVRDAKGTIIDASRRDLKFDGEGNQEKYSHWSAEKMYVNGSDKSLPSNLAKFDGNVLFNRGMCIFKDDVRLRVIFAGKTMNLLFRMPSLSQYDSRNFVVDSLPFKAGAYEITLKVTSVPSLNYYPASSWKTATRQTNVQ